MNPKVLVIVNPASARSRRAWPEIKDSLTQNGIPFDAYETTHAGDATDQTRRALGRQYEIIAVVGGDGTLSEAASGFFEFQTDEDENAFHPPASVKETAALAILPAGTGDDFARGLAGTRESLEKWLEIFINHCRGESDNSRVIDVIQGRARGGEHNFICLNVATIGLGAEVAARVATQGAAIKRLPGEARFVAAACGALIAWRERRVRVRVDDDEVVEIPTNLLAVANSTHAGGGMLFAPAARVDDGLIDLMLTHELTRSTILRELPRIRRGEHLKNPRVQVVHAKHVRIENIEPQDALLVEADGNLRGHTPAKFRILPRALRVIM